MSNQTIRPAYSSWPHFNQRLRDSVAAMTETQLLQKPGPDKWPLWATVGHLACQRVFWLCDFAGEPGKETTRFTNAAFDCPGDDDLENVLSAGVLAAQLDATFKIVGNVLDTWTFAMLDEVIDRSAFGPDWVHTRGWVLQRVFAHDVYHMGQVAQTQGLHGMVKVDIWG